MAYPLLPVHNGSGGGAEQILQLLDRGLTELGHRSLVLAAHGSQVSGTLIQTAVADGQIDDALRQQAQTEHRRAIHRTLERYPVDLIHFHGLDFLSYVPETPVPKLATLHLPLAWYPSQLFDAAGLALNCVSKSQAATAPAHVRLPVIQNGVDVDAFSARPAGSNGLLWLGRICPEKGTDIALRIAHRLRRPLTVAGPVHPFEWHQRYFNEQVEPLLDKERRYVGPVGLPEKRQLFSQAECVLIPSLVAETSSLVAMEAAASGTPVIAFSIGALPEIVEHGTSGFLVQNEAGMQDAVGRIHEISSDLCRQIAAQRFGFRSMVRSYVSSYAEMLSGRLSALPRDDQPALRNDS